MIAGVRSEGDEILPFIELKDTFLRSYIQRSKIIPCVRPRVNQSAGHQIFCVFRNCMDHTLLLSAPPRPSVPQSRCDFHVLEGIRHHATPRFGLTQPQTCLGCRLDRGIYMWNYGLLNFSIERASPSSGPHQVHDTARSACGCARCLALYRIHAALCCFAYTTLFAGSFASC